MSVAPAPLIAADFQKLTVGLNSLNDQDTYLVKTNEKHGGFKWIRQPVVSLKAEVDAAQPTGTDAYRNLDIYADTVETNDHVRLGAFKQLAIFCRAFTRGASSDKPMSLELKPGDALMIYSRTQTGSLYFQLATPGASSDKQTLVVPMDVTQAGVMLYHKADEKAIKVTPIASAKTRFKTPSIVEQLGDDGKYDLASTTPNPNFGNLLRFQMLQATAWQESRPLEAISLANYVVQSTKTTPTVVDLHLQGVSFLSRTVASSAAARRYVPTVDLSVTENVLKARLDALRTAETAFVNIQNLQKDETRTKSALKIALANSVDSDDKYRFLAELASKRYEQADFALTTANNNFEIDRANIDKAAEAFQAGVKKWADMQKIKAVGEMVVGIVAVGGAIAASVVAPPAAAAIGPAVAGVTVAVVDSASKFAQMVATLKRAWEVLKKVIDILKSGIMKMGGVMSALSNGVLLMKRLEKVGIANDKAEDSEFPLIGPSDVINATAEWDSFNAEMYNIMQPCINEKIVGSSEYLTAVQKLTIRAKAVLACQQVVTETGDVYMTTMAQSLQSQRSTTRLTAAIDNVANDERILKIIKTSMLERVVSTRSWVAIDFQDHVAAYRWYGLTDVSPIDTANPTKPLDSLFSDAATLQQAIREVDGTIRSQTKIFRFSTKDANAAAVFNPTWRDTLASSSRSVLLILDATHPDFAGFNRVRLRTFRAFANGIQVPSTVSIRAELSGYVSDRAANGQVKTFLTGSHKFLFEYDPKTAEIRADGQYASQGKYFLPSPFTNWVLTLTTPDAKVDSVQDVTVDLTCELSLN